MPGGDADAVYTAVDALMDAPIPNNSEERTDVQEEIVGSLDRGSRWKKGTKAGRTARSVERRPPKEELGEVKTEVAVPDTSGGAFSSGAAHAAPPPREEAQVPEEILLGICLPKVEAGPTSKLAMAASKPVLHTVVSTTDGKARMVGGVGRGGVTSGSFRC